MSYYDAIELEAMRFEKEEDQYLYPCPCGDNFILTVDDLLNLEQLAPCMSCSLQLKVKYDPEAFLESLDLDKLDLRDEQPESSTYSQEGGSAQKQTSDEEDE